MREYYNPKLRTSILRNENDLGDIEQGNLTFLKEGQEAVAYIDVSDTARIPVLPVWEEVDTPQTPASDKIREQIGELDESITDYELALSYIPQPGTLIVYFDGYSDYFKDVQETIPDSGVSTLISELGELGTATLVYPTDEEQQLGTKAKIIVTLSTTPLMSGGRIYAEYSKED